MLLTQWVELKRLEDFKNPGSQADGSFFGITDDFKGVSNGCVIEVAMIVIIIIVTTGTPVASTLISWVFLVAMPPSLRS